MNLRVDLRHLRALPRPGNLDSFYPALGDLECGLLDGGCLAFARAAQSVLGGEVWVVHNRANRPDHYALRVEADCFLDGDGLASGADLCEKLVTVEHAAGPMSLRAASEKEWRHGSIPPGDDLQPALAASVREWLGQVAPDLPPTTVGEERLAMHQLPCPATEPDRGVMERQMD